MMTKYATFKKPSTPNLYLASFFIETLNALKNKSEFEDKNKICYQILIKVAKLIDGKII